MTMEVPDRRLVDDAARALRGARRVLFITGAGLSADSGLPTYRGVGGLYDGRDAEENLPIETILSGDMLDARPELTWKYLGEIERASRGSTFNRGHRIIADFESRFDEALTLTQNVDGFHRAAGATNVIDIHGDLHDLFCPACDWRERVADYTALDALPRCPECGVIIRPDVVLFGEMLPTGKIERLYREVEIGFDVVLSIGTTSVFPYIAQPVFAVRRTGGVAIEINPGTTEVSPFVSIRIAAGAAATLEAIAERLG